MQVRSRYLVAASMMALSGASAKAQVAPPTQSQASSGTPDTQPASSSSSESANSIAEIIVTANKRSESIDRVPLAIAAVAGDTLRKEGVSSVQDLSRIIPALNVSQATFGTDVYTIRGVGFYDTTLAAVPAVSVYTDEAPLPFSVMSKGASLDPERVEVLMGPQGTLFGENATGGAINYIAAKPTKDFTVGLTGTVGNYGTVNGEGYVSGPLSSTLGARLSFRSLNSFQGYQDSATRDDHLGKVHLQEGRLLLDWKPTNRLTFVLNVNGFVDKSDTQAPQYFGYLLSYPTLAAFVPQLTSAATTGGSASRADWDPNTPFRKNDNFYQIALRGDYALGDQLTLTDIGSYSHYNHDQFQEGDGLAITVINERVVGNISNFSNELRLAGDLTDRMKFIVGGNYRDGTVNQHDLGSIDNYTASFLPTLFNSTRWRTFENLANQKIRSYAFFANLDYDLTDKVALHAGGRYTNSKNDLNGCSLGDAGVTLLAKSTNPPGQCLTLLPTGVSGAYVSRLAENNISWRFGIDYKPVAGTLVYFNASRGYKAGGYPVIPATNYVQLTPALQEELTSYEVGFKTNLAARTLRLSGALFRYDYVNKQILGREVVPVFGGLSKLINIPRSHVNGAELTLQWLPIAGLSLSGGFSYVDSKIENYSNYDVANAIVNLDGASFPNAPSFRGTAAAEYDRSLSTSLNAFAGADYSHVSNTRGTLGFTPQLNIPGYDLIGLRVGLHVSDDKWRVMLWVKNLTDKYYLTGTNRDGEALIGFAGMPRTFGATASVKFK